MTTTLNYLPQDTLYRSLPDEARAWIYLADQPIPNDYLPQMRQALERFATTWTSHNQLLCAYGTVLLDRFVLFAIDDTAVRASGCSVDESVRFVGFLGEQTGLNFLDRMRFAWLNGDEVCSGTREEFARRFAEGELNDATLVFDNHVRDKAAFEREWIKPLSQSWHRRMV